MKLQILITQYEETEDILRPMLVSISTQQGVDLKEDIEVVIANDGSDVKLSEEFLGSFPYPIRYLSCEHSGLPGCRAKLFEVAEADYVMFCDADDMFFSSLGLNTIFAYMEKGFDAFASEFYEEIRDRKTGQAVYTVRKNDSTFVHGKVYRRQYLLDNDIVWHPELKGHEDSCFNILAQKLAEKFVYCPVPFYLWRWRDDSICRKDPWYIPKTYCYMIDSNEQLVTDFLAHGDTKNAALYANAMVYAAYYCMNRDIWRDLESVKYRYDTEKRFQEYYTRHKPLIESASLKDKRVAISSMRKQAEKEGLLLERFSFDDWIKHIEEL